MRLGVGRGGGGGGGGRERERERERETDRQTDAALFLAIPSVQQGVLCEAISRSIQTVETKELQK